MNSLGKPTHLFGAPESARNVPEVSTQNSARHDGGEARVSRESDGNFSEVYPFIFHSRERSWNIKVSVHFMQMSDYNF